MRVAHVLPVLAAANLRKVMHLGVLSLCKLQLQMTAAFRLTELQQAVCFAL